MPACIVTPSNSQQWLAALGMAINGQFPEGIRDKGLLPMSDE